MNRSEHTYFYEDPQDMSGTDLQALIASRLEDMADQVSLLFAQGLLEEAELLRTEGLALAEAFDDGTTFLFINDLTEAK
jgi:hypothetical protein